MADPVTKQCTKCARNLNLSEFGRDAKRPDGLNCWCRSCKSEAKRRYYLANRDKVKEQVERYRAANLEAYREGQRRYRQRNPRQLTPDQRKQAQERGRQWRLANAERKRELTRLWNEANPEKRRESAARHRQRYPLYKTWEQMLNRCENERSKDYPRYGARGVTVCPQWHEYEVFAADIERLIGPRPEGKTLDRIDNASGYEAGNVKWSTPKEQAANRRPPAQWRPRTPVAPKGARLCQQCGASFNPRSTRAMYCSSRCCQAAFRRRRAAARTA